MLYYELLGPTRGRNTNFVLNAGIYAIDQYSAEDQMPTGMISYRANRIWREEDGKVRYVKHKDGDPANREVDMKEFLFIKLTAELI